MMDDEHRSILSKSSDESGDSQQLPPSKSSDELIERYPFLSDLPDKLRKMYRSIVSGDKPRFPLSISPEDLGNEYQLPGGEEDDMYGIKKLGAHHFRPTQSHEHQYDVAGAPYEFCMDRYKVASNSYVQNPTGYAHLWASPREPPL